jgi:hypothetical protein
MTVMIMGDRELLLLEEERVTEGPLGIFSRVYYVVVHLLEGA